MAVAFSFVVGIVGNIISILVFTSPIKTFWGVVKKKSTENYKEIPYITTLLSTSLWTFYGLIKPHGILIVTVNGVGVVLQFVYVTIFLVYAPRDTKIKAGKLIAMLNVGFLGCVVALTLLAIRESVKLSFVGVICAALTIGMYASPLSAMGMVVKMKSVEYMPFLLSFFLFLNAGIWSLYAALVKDYYIGVPNAIGFVLGMAQLVIYAMYKKKAEESPDTELEDGSVNLVNPGDFAVNVVVDNQYDEEAANLNCRSLSKGHSLPKPLVDRLYNVPIIKTISLSSYELDSAWALGGVVIDNNAPKVPPP